MSNLFKRGSPSGFSLLELLIVAALTTLIVAGVAEGLGLFARQVETVRAESDKRPEEALALMTDMARYGWIVEHPAAGRLDVVDALGARTAFTVVDGDLRVTRPSGTSGVLLSGVESLSVETNSLRRLRDAPPLDVHRAWWQASGAVASSGLLELESGLPVGLGFTLSSLVPDAYDVVEGVDEHTVLASLETLVLSVAYVGNFPEDPNAPITGGGNPPPGQSGKVTICHVPPGNPSKAHTLSISVNALNAHLAHGDWVGSCEAPPDVQVFPDLTVQLFEARAPDDARPVGEPLASMTLVSLALPIGSARWVPTQMGENRHAVHDHGPEECAVTTPSGKVVICHVPPGNPSKAHVIEVAPAAVAAHLAHGDYLGCCGQHEVTSTVHTLVVDAEPAEISIDLAQLGAVIYPGRAYTLVLSLSGPGVLVIGSSEAASAVHSGVAQAATPYGALQPVARRVPFRLEGMQRITQTAEHEPVSRVSLKLTMSNGRAVGGSASVASQTGVPGVWRGTVSGQIVGLQAAGLDP